MIDWLMKNRLIYIFPIIIFVIFAVWWLFMHAFELEVTRNYRQLWGASYQILALYGGLVGLFISKKWGGYKSLIGKIILAFSIGLLLQVFGQSYSSYYVYYYQVESPPYPAIGDIGFFGSVLFYIYGVILLAKASGIGSQIRKTHNKIWAFIIPFIILSAAYLFFLKGYEFDPNNLLLDFLDFGYPLGQAFYVSLAVLALFLSRNVLGGLMRKPLIFLIFALIFQYFSDVYFLYQAHAGTWYVGNINDFLYCASYFIMALAIINMGKILTTIKES
jgi:hypothetical protein